MFYISSYLFCNFWTLLFGCTPPTKFWNPDIPGHCINIKTSDIIYAIMSVSADLFLAILPLPMIWRLQLSRKEKIGLSLVLGTGAMYLSIQEIYILKETANVRPVLAPWQLYEPSTQFMISMELIDHGLPVTPLCGGLNSRILPPAFD